MEKIVSKEALLNAYNASKGRLALRCADIHNIQSPKKEICCCGGTGCHASNSIELMDNLRSLIKEHLLSNISLHRSTCKVGIREHLHLDTFLSHI